ncbi:MAG: response regulator [Ferruginibacter sp.]
MENNDIPILIVSAKNSSADRVLGLKKGADDYLTKPFNLEELLLRVSKLVKKKPAHCGRKPLTEIYQFGKNSVDFKVLAMHYKRRQKNYTYQKRDHAVEVADRK